MQLEVRAVSVVHGPHDRAVALRVAQAEGVADLMGGDDPQVEAGALPFGPQLVAVKVDDARLGGVGVG